MRNFNTNQTRHFFTTGIVVDGVTTSAVLKSYASVNGGAAEGIFFSGVTADGVQYRTDTIDLKKIVSLKQTAAADMATKLQMVELMPDVNKVYIGASSAHIGKTFSVTVTIHGLFDYDMDNSLSFTASFIGNASNLASQAAFCEAMANAIAKAMPVNDPAYPLVKVFYDGNEVDKQHPASGSDTKVCLVQGIQKYVRGKLDGEPCPFSVYSDIDGDCIDFLVLNAKGLIEYKDSNIAGNMVVPANYILADLEYFAMGERGDYVRGYNYPNNIEPIFAINPKSANDYDVLSIEYYWSGNAENVQKSPRLLQIAGSAASITALYNGVKALL